MPKKRKLGSPNPRYHRVEVKEDDTWIVRKHMCDAIIRDASGNDTGRKAPVYGVWEKKIWI